MPLTVARRMPPRTIHLSSLDQQQHVHGPFSSAVNQDLEVIDGQLAQLFAASRANDPDAVALVVSDHGFVPITHHVNLMLPFLHANLVVRSAQRHCGNLGTRCHQAARRISRRVVPHRHEARLLSDRRCDQRPGERGARHHRQPGFSPQYPEMRAAFLNVRLPAAGFALLPIRQ